MNDYEGEIVLQDIEKMKAQISGLEVKIAALGVLASYIPEDVTNKHIPKGCCREKEEEE
jgi:hypothetical protein|tara:strand:+ start:89 stop:265 length:177 start_codon:yes stop_codon:yes gene_type:complete